MDLITEVTRTVRAVVSRHAFLVDGSCKNTSRQHGVQVLSVELIVDIPGHTSLYQREIVIQHVMDEIEEEVSIDMSSLTTSEMGSGGGWEGAVLFFVWTKEGFEEPTSSDTSLYVSDTSEAFVNYLVTNDITEKAGWYTDNPWGEVIEEWETTKFFADDEDDAEPVTMSRVIVQHSLYGRKSLYRLGFADGSGKVYGSLADARKMLTSMGALLSATNRF